MTVRHGVLCVMATVFSLVTLSVQQEPRYFKLRGTLELVPDIPPGTLKTGLLWKLGPDKAVEWDTAYSETDIDYYRTFKGRSTLDLSTGKLVVTDLTKEDSGVYSLELNSKPLPKTYTVYIIGSVLKPTVSWKPLSCGPHLPSCLLSCDGEPTGDGPVTYSWRTDEGDWEDFQKEKLPNITNDEEVKKVKTVSCKLRNPVSEEQSDPKENPFYSAREGGGGAGPIVGGIIGVILVILAIVVLFWKRETIMEKLRSRGVEDTSQHADQQAPLVTKTDTVTESPPTLTPTAVEMNTIPGSTDRHTASTEVAYETDRPNTAVEMNAIPGSTDRHTASTEVAYETDRPNTDVVNETDRPTAGDVTPPNGPQTGPGENESLNRDGGGSAPGGPS